MARRKGRPTRDDAEPRPAPGDPRGEEWDGPARFHEEIIYRLDGSVVRNVIDTTDDLWVELDDTYEGLRFPPSAGS